MGAHASLSVAKGCCPGKDVRSPSRTRLRCAVAISLGLNCNNKCQILRFGAFSPFRNWNRFSDRQQIATYTRKLPKSTGNWSEEPTRLRYVIARAYSLLQTRDEARAVPKARRVPNYARTGTLAVRSSLPQLTQAPLIARRMAFQMQ